MIDKIVAALIVAALAVGMVLAWQAGEPAPAREITHVWDGFCPVGTMANDAFDGCEPLLGTAD